jgi:hypothetical protein
MLDNTADTLTNKTYDASATGNVFTQKLQKDFSLLSPTASDNTMLFKAQHAMTITDIHCIVDPADTGDSITVNIMECNATGDSCATVDAAITCDNDGAEDDGSFSNGSIDAGDWVSVEFGDTLSFSIYYSEAQ